MIRADRQAAWTGPLLIAGALILAGMTNQAAWGNSGGALDRSELDDRPQSAPASTPATIELREGLAISGGGARRRAAIETDPIAAALVAGTWTMPKAGDAVVFSGGRTEHWKPIKVGDDGWFSSPASRGGYVAATFSSATAGIMILEASGHSVTYFDREPRAGDIYQTGFVHLPVRVRAGQNQVLFQAGRGRLKARLIAPKAPAFLSTADATTPDLLSGEPAVAEAAIVVVNATESLRDDLVIVARLPGGPGPRALYRLSFLSRSVRSASRSRSRPRAARDPV